MNPPILRRVRRVTSSLVRLALLLAGACSSDERRDHVYMSPPPKAHRPPPTPAPAIPEPALGSVPTARIVGVRAAATGAPSSVEGIDRPIEVLVVVSRGRSHSGARPARVELALRGPVDTLASVLVPAPVPVILSQAFVLPVGGAGGLPAGRYVARVRLVEAPGRVLAESPGLALVVRP